MSVAIRLGDLGLELPTRSATFGAYVPAVKSGDFIFTSGQIPVVGGELIATGLVSEAPDTEPGFVSIEVAQECAKQCIVNALGAISTLAELDDLDQIVKLTGFVASTPGFTAQPKVLDAASNLLAEIFGHSAQHARSAVGVAQLPLGAPVEIELVVRAAAR